MPLTIKTLQARSRASHSALAINTQELLACPSVIAKRQALRPFGRPFAPVLRLTPLPLARRVTMPDTSLASDLFALGIVASRTYGTYDSIACSPGIGRNLSAKA